MKIGDPVLPYLNKQPYCSYSVSKLIEKEIKRIAEFKKMPPSPELDVKIIELINKLTLSDNDYDNSGKLKEKKRVEVNFAQSALEAIGAPVIPHLLPLVGKAYLSNMGGNATGWTAFEILINIGEPVLPYLESPEYSNDGIIQEIIKGIKEKQGVIKEIQHLKEKAAE